MSMSDCPKCWDTPCTCGHDYESWSEERILEQIEMLKRVLKEIRKNKKKEGA
jgi:hypothetical protein